MIDKTKWQRIQALFEAALAVPISDREKLLNDCGADEDVSEIVGRMLKADEKGSQLIDSGIPAVAYDLLTPTIDEIAQPPTERFGPYKLIRPLGEGGMGVVWLAERTDTGNQVAVKFLPNAGLSPARLERFTQEVRLLAKLKHPSIAQFYDAGTLQDGTPWFVMEYVEGIDFNDYVKKLDSMRKRLLLFRSVCEAVQYAHGQAIIHRDLKPSNILVESSGTPKLLDFGIARELQTDDDERRLTARGPRFMSPHYSAPEWIKSAEVGVITDVYSLGVMLYEILSGSLPDADNVRLIDGTAPKPSSVIRTGSALDNRASLKFARISIGEWSDLDVLCLKAMHADPAKRYGSVEALIRDINHFLAGEPLEARPDSWGYRSSKFLRRNARMVTVMSAALALVVTMAIVFTTRLAYARNVALAAAARSNRIQEFTLSLFRSSGQLSDAPAKLTVETLVDRGAAEVQRLSQEAALQADLDQNLGQMYQDIGKLDKADQLASAALSIKESLPGIPIDSLEESRLRLALLRADENRAVEAEKMVRDIIRELEQRAPRT
jgi:Serine/threonine protein kinase